MASIAGIADEIHETIYETLTGDATLTSALTGGVYDDAERRSTFPYIEMGEAYTVKDATFDKDGQVVVVRLHVWSRYKGSKEAWAIIGHIGRLLDEVAISVDGASVQSCTVENGRVLKDPDGLTRHGVCDVRVSIAET